MKLNVIGKGILLLAIVALTFSCSEDEGDTCNEPQNVCNASDPKEVELVICEDGDGNTTYTVDGETYATEEEALAAVSCGATAKADILQRIKSITNEFISSGR